MKIVEAAGRWYLSGEVREALYGGHGSVFGTFLMVAVARMLSARPTLFSGYRASSTSRMKDSEGIVLPRTAFLWNSDSFPKLTCLVCGDGAGLRLIPVGRLSSTGMTVGKTYCLNVSSLPWGSSFKEETFDMASSSVGVFRYDGGPSAYGILRDGVEDWAIVVVR